ncbi:ABC transporter permease [Streptosporangium sp. NPDC051022]|uniref:ABC transporter permease n=1 Tax=Streptosporangium sp. NPDC051022 TaxID=3155752 RepID=UPI003435F85D
MSATQPPVRLARLIRVPGPASRAMWAGLAFIVAVLALSFLLPVVTGHGSDEFVAEPLLPPSPEHPFGTDQFGRDLLVRTMAAARVDYLIGVVVIVWCGVVGSLVGVLMATTRRAGADWVFSRIIDASIAFPLTILVIAVGVILGPDFTVLGLPRGLPSVLIVYALIGWAYYARLARSQALSLRSRDFVRAARTMGYSDMRITMRHLFPQVSMVTMAYAVGDAIVAIALTSSLAFLGAGVAPPTPEWGQIMYEGRDLISTSWWIVAFPATMLALSGISLAAIANGVIKRIEG